MQRKEQLIKSCIPQTWGQRQESETPMEQILFMPKMLRGSQENTKFNNLLGTPTQRKYNIHKYLELLQTYNWRQPQ